MPSIESADARTVLMATYLSRYPPAGIISHQTSRSDVQTRMRIPAESRQRGGITKLGTGAFLKDETLRRAGDGKIVRVPFGQTKGDFGVQGRTIYDDGSSAEPKFCPTVAALARIESEASRYASDRLKALGVGWEEMEHEKMEFRSRKSMGEMFLTAPSPGVTNIAYPGLSSSRSSGPHAMDSEMSYEYSMESCKADEMFDMFINADECADVECMDKGQILGIGGR
jgi:hypothetical protein